MKTFRFLAAAIVLGVVALTPMQAKAIVICPATIKYGDKLVCLQLLVMDGSSVIGRTAFAFDGVAGDVVKVELGADKSIPEVDLIGPNGLVLAHASGTALVRTATIESARLPQSGTYSIVPKGTSGNTITVTLTKIVERPNVIAGRLRVGESKSAMMKATTEYWEFEGKRGDQATVGMESLTVDPSLELYDPKGALVAKNDRYAATENAQILVSELSLDGTYRIHAKSANGKLGKYQISVFDLNLYTGKMGYISIGTPEEGRALAEAGAWAAIDPTDGQILTIEVSSDTAEPQVDLFNIDQLIASDDNSGADGRGARITSPPLITGGDNAYWIRVTMSDGSAGTFTVKVSEGNPEPDGSDDPDKPSSVCEPSGVKPHITNRGLPDLRSGALDNLNQVWLIKNPDPQATTTRARFAALELLAGDTLTIMDTAGCVYQHLSGPMDCTDWRTLPTCPGWTAAVPGNALLLNISTGGRHGNLNQLKIAEAKATKLRVRFDADPPQGYRAYMSQTVYEGRQIELASGKIPPPLGVKGHAQFLYHLALYLYVPTTVQVDKPVDVILDIVPLGPMFEDELWSVAPAYGESRVQGTVAIVYDDRVGYQPEASRWERIAVSAKDGRKVGPLSDDSAWVAFLQRRAGQFLNFTVDAVASSLKLDVWNKVRELTMDSYQDLKELGLIQGAADRPETWIVTEKDYDIAEMPLLSASQFERLRLTVPLQFSGRTELPVRILVRTEALGPSNGPDFDSPHLRGTLLAELQFK